MCEITSGLWNVPQMTPKSSPSVQRVVDRPIKENKTTGYGYQLGKVFRLYTSQGKSTFAFGDCLRPRRGLKGRVPPSP